MRIALSLLASALFAGAAFAQNVPDGQLTGPALYSNGNAPPPGAKKQPNNPVDDAQATAEQLRLQGRCDLAVPKLRYYAGRMGSQIPQYDLGLCLLDLAKSAPSPDAAGSMRKEGAVWLLRSANAGFAKAQAQAVELYFDGTGVDRDPVEAQKWVLLYQGSAMRRMLRLPDLAQDLQDKVDASLDATGRATAEARADSWGQTYWPATDNQ